MVNSPSPWRLQDPETDTKGDESSIIIMRLMIASERMSTMFGIRSSKQELRLVQLLPANKAGSVVVTTCDIESSGPLMAKVFFSFCIYYSSSYCQHGAVVYS